MNQIAVKELQVGKYFSEPVYLDDEFMILSPEVPVSLGLVNRLTAWGIGFVYSAGTQSDEAPSGLFGDEPGVLAAIDETEEEQETRDKVFAFFRDLIAFVDRTYRGLTDENHLNPPAVSETVRSVLEIVREDADSALSLLGDRDLMDIEDYNVSHCAAAAVLSVVLGDSLKVPPHRLIELGTAALLHKVGLTKLPRNLYMRSGGLNDQERKTLAAYPVLGYRILKGFSVSENVARGVLEQQERYDGSGYPRGLQGENISVYARVIGVAASYSAIVAKRPYREASDGHAGIMDLLRTNRSVYDEKVLKALVYCLSVFPLGTYVLLNNGIKAVVHRSNPKDPRCPTVKMLTDKDGNPLKEKPLIAMSQEKGIMIARSLSRL